MGYLQLAETRLKLDNGDMKLIIKPLEDLGKSTELIANVRDIQKWRKGAKVSSLWTSVPCSREDQRRSTRTHWAEM